MIETTIKIPDSLSINPDKLNSVYQMLVGLPVSDRYVLDMNQVKFAHPYGVVGLVMASRILSNRSRNPVVIKNLKKDIHQYFHRMDIFSVAKSWLQVSDQIDEEWLRNPSTPNLLELTLIRDQNDILKIVTRTEEIFSRWLIVSNLRFLLTSVSELCTNMLEHSQDSYGCILIQKYALATLNQVKVCLAAGDLGIGIRGSLSNRFGSPELEPQYFLHKAMEGSTARFTGRGGLGLRTVEKIAAENEGYLWIRSETASIMSRGERKRQEQVALVNIPGTQVVFEFKSSN